MIPNPTARTTADDLREVWPILTPEERVEAFRQLPNDEAEAFFETLSSRGQSIIVRGSPAGEKKLWLRTLPPDDVADVIQELPAEERPDLVALLDPITRREVNVLLAYSEDQAGGLMSPRFARVRPDMTVDEAISYLRRQVRDHLETVYYAYVLDAGQKLQGVISLRELLSARGDKPVAEIMSREAVTVPDHLDQEAVAAEIARHDLLAVPVLDAEGRMKGIVTVDDVVDVVQSEATEDIHKIGGLEALEFPYLQTRFFPMLRKRAGWLAVLFLGEMLTASAMAHYEEVLERAIVLMLFVPLIMSSGGNSGSQASTLVIRAMSLGEVRLRDWWRVVRREIGTGLALGSVLAILGFLRVAAWEHFFGSYGEHYVLIGLAVAFALIGVVTWGTITGSMLPFILRRVGFDPASASAPFVATLVDVIGLGIYFNVAWFLLRGSLLADVQ